MITSTLTDKGQTTVPLEIRDALGMAPRQRLVWKTMKDGSAVVRKAPSVMELAGCLKSKVRFTSIKAETEAATSGWIGEHAKTKSR